MSDEKPVAEAEEKSVEQEPKYNIVNETVDEKVIRKIVRPSDGTEVFSVSGEFTDSSRS